MTTLHMRTVHEPQLPPMAWLVRIERATATVHLGSRVEVWENGFFEGAYAGRWIDDDPSQCADVFGSGMVIRNGAFHIVTPSHTLEAVFVCQHDGVTVASNSLAFLVERLQIDVPVRYDYSARFVSVIKGINQYARNIINADDGLVQRIVHQNILITGADAVKLVDKPHGDGFTTYSEYICHLANVVDEVFANGRSPLRRFSYTPISTISSGFDSPFIAALAATRGLEQTVSVESARHEQNDSGVTVAEMLGLDALQVSRPSFASATLESLAEFCVSGMGAEDYVYVEFLKLLEGAMLLTGFQGSIWQTSSLPNNIMQRNDCSGSTLQEHRLRVGFIHIPLPTVGIPSHYDVFRISVLEEMTPYRIESPYDKPIPRRYLEERGVPYQAFGQTKKAASILFFIRFGFRSHLSFRNHQFSEATRNDILSRAARIGAGPFGRTYRRDAAWWVIKRQALRKLTKISSTAHKLSKRWPSVVARVDEAAGTRIHEVARYHELDQPILSLMFLVSLDIVRERYRLPSRSTSIGGGPK